MQKIIKFFPIYGSHVLKIFSFIILLPLFTNNFSKDTWGLVVAAQAFSFWLQIIVEYGFNLSATRNIVQMRFDIQKVGGYVLAVNNSKLILSAIAIIISSVSFFTIPSIHRFGNLAYFATLFGIVQGLSPIWYYLAMERFHIYSTFDFISRLIYIILCFYLIDSDKQAYLVFLLGIIANGVTVAASFLSIYKLIKRVKVIKYSVITAMQSSFSLFLFAMVTSVYTSINILILSHYAPLSIVAIYGIADRVVRTGGNLLDPLNRIFFARMSKSYTSDVFSAIKNLKNLSLSLALAGSVIFLGLEIFSPLIIRIIAPNYSQSVAFIRVLAIYLPILIGNNILGLHILLPLGYDKEFNIVFVLVSIVSLILMFAFVPRFGGLGLAIITIFTELGIVVGFLIIIFRHGGLTKMIDSFNNKNREIA